MFNQIKALLQDTQLRQQLKTSNTPAEAVCLVRAAASAQGYSFTSENIAEALFASQSPTELSEEDLPAVAAANMTGPSGHISCWTQGCKPN